MHYFYNCKSNACGSYTRFHTSPAVWTDTAKLLAGLYVKVARLQVQSGLTPGSKCMLAHKF